MRGRHYERVAAEYSKALFYSEGPLKLWQVGVLAKALGPVGCGRFADVGGGDGMFGMALAGALGDDVEVTLVEPSAAMVASNTREKPSLTLNVDGASWAASSDDGRYDRVLMKEVVHHLEDRPRLFRAIRENKLKEGGAIVIATRPKFDIDYPFFEAAKRVWQRNQPDTFEAELREAGFTRVTHQVDAYPLEVSLSVWIDMIRGRFWSTFDEFDDDEIERGIQELHTTYDSPLRFEERLLTFVAS